MTNENAGDGINIYALAAAAEHHPSGHAIDAYATSGVSPPKLAAIQPILDRCRKADIWIVDKGRAPSHRQGVALQPGHLNAHFASTYKVGLCPIERGGSTVRLALLDLDSHKGESSWEDMVEAARRLIVAGAKHGIIFVAFRSTGGRGIHLYAIWDEAQHVHSVRALLAGLLADCGFANGTRGVAAGQVEIFPKQDAVPADGWGSMFILPGAGQSEPLDPETLDEIGWDAVAWSTSEPVPLVAAPKFEATVSAGPQQYEKVRSALMSLDPNDYDYDGWLRMLFAVHASTEASEEGRALIHDWSAQFARYMPEETDKQWNAARLDKAGGIGWGTLRAAACAAGWVDPDTGSTGFDVFAAAPVDVEAETKRLQEVFGRGKQTEDDARALAALPCEAREQIVESLGLALPDEEMAALRGTLAAIERAKAAGQDLPVVLTRNSRGKIEASYTNVYAACERADVVGLSIGYDEFLDEVVISNDAGVNWAAMTDADYVEIQRRLESAGFSRVAKEMLRDVVGAVAHKVKRFDTAKFWLSEIVPAWDGTPRVERFLSVYLGAEDTPYTRAVALYQWTAMVGRVLDPGCQADMAPVWVGPQGARKSSVARALVPDAKFFKELSFGERDADLSRKMRGLLIGELSELRGLATRELEAVKAWITQRHEHWTPKFKEFGTAFARRCIFIGTTNQHQFLADETGERRWLPVMVGACDPDAVARDREQLWAEARQMYLRGGIAWRDAERLAETEHDQYKVHDAWADVIHRWLDEEPLPLSGEAQDPGRRRDRPFTTGEVMSGALSIGTAHQRPAEQQRVARILRAAGFECDKTQSRVAGDRVRYWRATR